MKCFQNRKFIYCSILLFGTLFSNEGVAQISPENPFELSIGRGWWSPRFLFGLKSDPVLKDSMSQVNSGDNPKSETLILNELNLDPRSSFGSTRTKFIGPVLSIEFQLQYSQTESREQLVKSLFGIQYKSSFYTRPPLIETSGYFSDERTLRFRTVYGKLKFSELFSGEGRYALGVGLMSFIIPTTDYSSYLVKSSEPFYYANSVRSLKSSYYSFTPIISVQQHIKENEQAKMNLECSFVYASIWDRQSKSWSPLNNQQTWLITMGLNFEMKVKP